MKYKITMQSGKEIIYTSKRELRDITDDINSTKNLFITKGIWVVTSCIESIEVINE